MKTASLLKIVILLTAMASMVAGCGSGGSVATGNTGSNPPSNGTGSIAAKLAWSTSGTAKSTGKILYAAPAGIATIKISVYDSTMVSLITPHDFTVIAGADGSGTISGIPVGTGRIVKAQGLDANGYLIYSGQVTGVQIDLGKVTNVGTITLTPQPSATSANPAGSTVTGPLTVTLTSQPILQPVTIYYTTHSAGATPPFTQYSGVSPIWNIPVYSATPVPLTTVILEFFSRNSMGALETNRTETYTISP